VAGIGQFANESGNLLVSPRRILDWKTEHTADDANRICVCQQFGISEGKTPYRASNVVADAWESQQVGLPFRYSAAELANEDNAHSGDQIDSPSQSERIQNLPEVPFGGTGERSQAAVPTEQTAVDGEDLFGMSSMEEDFGEENPVRVLSTPPWERAPMVATPGCERPAEGRRIYMMAVCLHSHV
jgi:hypothetical protein